MGNVKENEVDIDEAWEEFRRQYEKLIVGTREVELQSEVKYLKLEVVRLNAVIEAYKELMNTK